MSGSALFEIRISAGAAARRALVPALFRAGVAGIEERKGGKLLVVYASTRKDARRLERIAAKVAAHVEVARVQSAGWDTEWTRYLGPESITPSIVLQPRADPTPAPRGKRRLVFEPDLVFGVGSHATTQLAARAAELHCRRTRGARGSSVLDVGTGTGVLAMVAVVSGAKRALGIDIDRRALTSARRNARMNDLDSSCRFSSTPLRRLRGSYDVVVANLEERALVLEIPDLARLTARAGVLLITGFVAERAGWVAARFAPSGLEVACKRRRGEFALLELRRRWAKPAKVGTKPPSHVRSGRRKQARAGRRRQASVGQRRRGELSRAR